MHNRAAHLNFLPSFSGFIRPSRRLTKRGNSKGSVPTISFCLIVKNEAAKLARCLESLFGIANEIIIVDTGSTDQTLEIAKRYTDKIFHHEWNDHYAEARNVALSHAKGDWIGIIDADEVLPAETVHLIPDFLKRPDFQNRDIVLNWRVCSDTQADIYRRGFFPNHRGIHFAGRVHEIPVLPAGQLDAYKCHELVLLHNSTESECLAKEEYYQALLKRSLLEEQNPLLRIHAQKHLGLSYILTRDWQAAWDLLNECYLGMRSKEINPQDGFYGEVLRGLVQVGLKLELPQTSRFASELNLWYPLEPVGIQALRHASQAKQANHSLPRTKRLLFWAGLSLLSACQMVPHVNPKPNEAKSGFVLASYGASPSPGASGEPGSQLRTFPNFVPVQTFSSLPEPDANTKFRWVRFVVPKEAPPQVPQTEITGSDEDDQPNQDGTESNQDLPPDNAIEKHRVWIPETGSFNVQFVAGPKFEITDNDARDGLAIIQMPSELLDGFLQLRGPKSRAAKRNKPAIDRQLILEDQLYYVNQTINRLLPDTGSQSWINLNKRPFSPSSQLTTSDGYVMKFTNQGVQKFVTRWYRTPSGSQPEYPVGTQEIGTAGGTVELPNVAKLEIPAGALSSKTLVRLTQPTQARPQWQSCSTPDTPQYCSSGNLFVTPIVKLEPLNLEPSQPVKLSYLNYLREGYYQHPARMIGMGSSDPLSEIFDTQDTLKGDPSITDINQIKRNEDIWVYKFQYIAKLSSGPRLAPDESENFSTQQVTTPPTPRDCPIKTTPYFYIFDANIGQDQNSCFTYFDPPNWSGPASVTQTNAAHYLDQAYLHYASLRLPAPKTANHFSKFFGNLTPKIEVLLSTKIKDQVRDSQGNPFLDSQGEPTWQFLSRDVPGLTTPLWDKNNVYTSSYTQLAVLPFNKGIIPNQGEPQSYKYDHFSEAITAAHELVHHFQMTYINNPSQLMSKEENYFREGTATYLGTKFVVDNFTHLNNNFNIDDFYHHETQYSGYIDSLNLLMKRSFNLLDVTIGNGMQEALDAYDATMFFTYLASAKNQDQTIADSIVQWGQIVGQSNNPPRANVALNNLLGGDNKLQEEYGKFAVTAFAKKKDSASVVLSDQFLVPYTLMSGSLPIPYPSIVDSVELEHPDREQSLSNPLQPTIGLQGRDSWRFVPNLGSSYILLKPAYPNYVNKNQTLKVCLRRRDNADLSAFVVGLKNTDGLGFDPQNPQEEQILEVKEVGKGITLIPPGEPRNANGNIVSQEQSCVELPNFGEESTHKSAVVVLANGNWSTNPGEGLYIHLDATIINKNHPVPMSNGCPNPSCHTKLTSASLSWPADPYPGFTTQKGGSTFSSTSSDLDGVSFGFNPLESEFDAAGKPIVTRARVSVQASAHSNDPIPFSRSASTGQFYMTSQDGIHFSVDTNAAQTTGSMSYGYSNGDVFYGPPGFACSPSVGGSGNGLVVGGSLTLSPPDVNSEDLIGKASLSLTLSGNVNADTNFIYWCKAAWEDEGGTEHVSGHKQSFSGPGNVSLSLSDIDMQYYNQTYHDP